jgi:hypothetical protein
VHSTWVFKVHVGVTKVGLLINYDKTKYKQTNCIQLNESYVRVNKDIEKDKYWDFASLIAPP